MISYLNGNNGIFVIHALNGYAMHENRISCLFKKTGLNYEFVTDGDPANFTDDLLGRYFVKNIGGIISKGIISCTLNHFLAYERIVSRNLNYGLIFENDPFFLNNFTRELDKSSNQIELLPKGFIVSLENSGLRFPSYWQAGKGKNLYRASKGRMAGAYLIDNEAASRILADLKQNKCDAVIDWWHNKLVKRELLAIYWIHPPLVEQGSHNGRLPSKLSSKKNNISRRIIWICLKYFKYYLKRLRNEKHLIDG